MDLLNSRFLEPQWVTPIKNSFIGSVTDENTVVRRLLEKQLATDFEPHLRRDIPVIDFIKLVYDFTPDKIPSKDYKLPPFQCEQFCKVKNEKSSYRYLQAILNDLQTQLYGKSTHCTRPLQSFFYALKEKWAISNHKAFKPDFFFSTNPLRKPWRRQDWSTALSYGEVKRSKGLQIEYEHHIIQLEKLFQVRLYLRVCFGRSDNMVSSLPRSLPRVFPEPGTPDVFFPAQVLRKPLRPLQSEKAYQTLWTYLNIRVRSSGQMK